MLVGRVTAAPPGVDDAARRLPGFYYDKQPKRWLKEQFPSHAQLSINTVRVHTGALRTRLRRQKFRVLMGSDRDAFSILQ